jgi:hypothetical protein
MAKHIYEIVALGVAFVDARIAEGSDYIKIIYDDGATYGLSFPTISREVLPAAITATKARGKLAVVHIGSRQGAQDAIAAGASGLVHIFADTPADAGWVGGRCRQGEFGVPQSATEIAGPSCRAQPGEGENYDRDGESTRQPSGPSRHKQRDARERAKADENHRRHDAGQLVPAHSVGVEPRGVREQVGSHQAASNNRHDGDAHCDEMPRPARSVWSVPRINPATTNASPNTNPTSGT